MGNAGAHDGRLATRGPRAFERRPQREAAFLLKAPGGAPVTALFLAEARRTASSARWPRRRVAGLGVGASSCSSPGVATAAPPRWEGNARPTGPKLSAQSGPGSNSPRYNPGRTLRALPPALISRAPELSSGALLLFSGALGSVSFASRVAPAARSLSSRLLVQLRLCPSASWPGGTSRVAVAPPPVRLFRLFSCPLYWHHVHLLVKTQ